MATSHPTWGVPLDEYIRSNPTDHTLYKISNEVISEKQLRTFAQNVIDEICEEKDVSVTKLESIMTLSHSPDTYTMFEDPALIHGCIKLLAGIKIHGRAAVCRFSLFERVLTVFSSLLAIIMDT
ncbi:hypothetical protein BDV93DRAFT_525020 [Ceratobasidium sp. AG-I]|nr:hypothetical protein BDV93DRAFT_525020 [Ceratobasidium sp. AG-I]